MTIYSLDGVSPTLPDDGDYWVAPDANLIGRVIVGSGVSIWFGSTLRGDNEPITIGEGTNIQEDCVFHTDMGYPATIGKNCTIGHKAMLHCCTIGEGTLIGMGAMVLDGAKVRKDCLIGAGALITEGKQIPDRSLVMGMPGRVIRKIDDVRLQANLDTAEHYRQNVAGAAWKPCRFDVVCISGDLDGDELDIDWIDNAF